MNNKLDIDGLISLLRSDSKTKKAIKEKEISSLIKVAR